MVSGATVALALVAQLDQIGDTFVTFASSVLPALLALGVTSYSRLADLAVHDAYYARAIGRIRSLYLTIEPAAQQYWLQPAGDDAHAVMRQAGQPHSRWHHLGHTATSVAAVVGVIAGALLGVVGSVLTPSALRFLPPARPCSLSLPSVGCWPTRSGAGAEPTVLCSPTSYPTGQPRRPCLHSVTARLRVVAVPRFRLWWVRPRSDRPGSRPSLRRAEAWWRPLPRTIAAKLRPVPPTDRRRTGFGFTLGREAHEKERPRCGR